MGTSRARVGLLLAGLAAAGACLALPRLYGVGYAFLAATAGGLLALLFEKPKAPPSPAPRPDLTKACDELLSQLPAGEDHARLRQDAADLLELARLEGPPDMRLSVSVAAWLPMVETACGPAAAAKGVRLRFKHEGGDLMGRPAVLLRAVADLVRHAVDRTPAGGEVEIWCGLFGEAELQVHVRDAGPAMPPESAAALFLPARSDGGSPGRALAKAVVEAHGGAIRVLSRPEQGTTIEVRLPRIPDVVSRKVY